MNDKWLVFVGFLGGIGLGAAIVSGGLRGSTEGFSAIPPQSSHIISGVADYRAELALPNLISPLRNDQSAELSKGLLFFAKANYADALTIIGKYALLGDATAQHAIGGMYAFGQGLPLDSKEGVRWLRLAADQGNRGAAELAATINANPDWERRVVAFAAATSREESARSGPTFTSEYPQSRSPAPQYDLSNTARANLYASSRSGYSDNSASAMVRPSASMGARSSADEAYGSTSASRRYLDTHATPPEANISTPKPETASSIILNRAGPSTYSDGRGDIYTQAGPHGVINTRTGEFSPTN